MRICYSFLEHDRFEEEVCEPFSDKACLSEILVWFLLEMISATSLRLSRQHCLGADTIHERISNSKLGDNVVQASGFTTYRRFYIFIIIIFRQRWWWNNLETFNESGTLTPHVSILFRLLSYALPFITRLTHVINKKKNTSSSPTMRFLCIALARGKSSNNKDAVRWLILKRYRGSHFRSSPSRLDSTELYCL